MDQNEIAVFQQSIEACEDPAEIARKVKLAFKRMPGEMALATSASLGTTSPGMLSGRRCEIPQFILNRKTPTKYPYFDKQKIRMWSEKVVRKKWSEKHGAHFKTQERWQAAPCRTRQGRTLGGDRMKKELSAGDVKAL